MIVHRPRGGLAAAQAAIEAGACQLRVEMDEPPAPEQEAKQPANIGAETGPTPEGLAASAYSPSGGGLPKRLVVIDGADRLKDGAAVTVPPAGAAGAPNAAAPQHGHRRRPPQPSSQ